jgi:hypothetical protein
MIRVQNQWSLTWGTHTPGGGYSKTFMGYARTSYTNKNETKETPEPWTSSDPRIQENLSLNWGAKQARNKLNHLINRPEINNWSII